MSKKHQDSLFLFLFAHPMAFVILAALRLTNIISWDWRVICIPIYLLVLEVVAGMIAGIYEHIKDQNHEQ